MKKIDGTLYSPIDPETGERQKMYVETIPEAIIMKDGATLQDKLDHRGSGVVISNTKPSKSCVWIAPEYTPTDYFDFSDIGIDVAEDDTPVYKLRTPADKNGNRTNVYPLTSTDAVYVNGEITLDDIFHDYDMGFVVGRDKPEYKAVWGNELFRTICIDDDGREEEVVILNDYLNNVALINDRPVRRKDFVFNYLEDGEEVTIVFFKPDNGFVTLSDSVPNKQTFWIDDIEHTYLDQFEMPGYLADMVNIDGTNYQAGDNKLIIYKDEDYAFLNPEKAVIAKKQPSVLVDTIWINTTKEEVYIEEVDLTAYATDEIEVDGTTYNADPNGIIQYEDSDFAFMDSDTSVITNGDIPEVVDPTMWIDKDV